MAAFVIRPDDLHDPQTQALLSLHLRSMRGASPQEFSFALDLDALRRPDIAVWSAWRGAVIAGVGALRRLDAVTAEIKSMRTHPDFLRQGVGAAMLTHLVTQARLDGVRDVYLETGSGPAFEAAIALYHRAGFVPTGPFGNYQASDFNRFYRLTV